MADKPLSDKDDPEITGQYSMVGAEPWKPSVPSEIAATAEGYPGIAHDMETMRLALLMAEETISKGMSWICGFICSGPEQEERKAGMEGECRAALVALSTLRTLKNAAQVPHGVCRADDPNREADQRAGSSTASPQATAPSASAEARGVAPSVSDDSAGTRIPVAACHLSAGERTFYANPQQRPERGEAVNLARCWLDAQAQNGGMHITTKGIRQLAEAVMLMDAWILEVTKASVPSSAPVAIEEVAKQAWLGIGEDASEWADAWDDAEFRDFCTKLVEAAWRGVSATAATPWNECQFEIVAWEINEGHIGISVKHAKGGSAWVVKPHEHVEKMLQDGLRYRFIRSEASHEVNGVWAKIADNGCNNEQMDAMIDEAMRSTDSRTDG